MPLSIILKAKAVATEDYVTAKKIKVVEGELKSLGTQLAQLVRVFCVELV